MASQRTSRVYDAPPTLRVEQLAKGIDLSGCELSSCPGNLLEYTQLTSLNMSQNSLTSIPPPLFDIPTLRHCDLSHNSIVNLVRKTPLEKWDKLHSLNLSHNCLFLLPASIAFLKSLKHLNLAHNELKELPIELCALSELETLQLANNQISALPKTLAKCRKLVSVDVKNNQLTTFPEMPESFCRDLKRVVVSGNPLQFPSASLCNLRDRNVELDLDNQTEWDRGDDLEDDSESSSEADVAPKGRLRSFKSRTSLREKIKHHRSPSEDLDDSSDGSSSGRTTSLLSRSRGASRSRSRSDAAKTQPPSRNLKRQSARISPLQLGSSGNTNSTTEFDLLPKSIRSNPDIEFVVENGAATVSSATEPQLVAMLTYDSGVDRERFQKIFYATYPTFIESMDLFKEIVKRFDSAGKVGRERVVETLSLWVDIQQVHILATSELKSNIVNFIAQHTEDAAHRDQLLIIASKLNDGVRSLPRDSGDSLPWESMKAKEIARNLCMINHRLLQEIPLTLFLDKRYTEEYAKKHPDNKLQQLTDWFNLESNWVVTSLLSSSSVVECSNLITLFIQVAQKCIGLQNFSSGMAIYSSLNTGAVQRLCSAWTQVPPKYTKMMSEFDRIFSFKMNYGVYREMLKNAEGPALPLMIIVFRDLTHFEEVNKDKFLDSGEEPFQIVNFARLSNLAPSLLEIRNYQLHEYEFGEKPAYLLEKCLRNIAPLAKEKDDLLRLADEKEKRDATELAGKRKKKRESTRSHSEYLAPQLDIANPRMRPMSENLAQSVTSYQASRRRSNSIEGEITVPSDAKQSPFISVEMQKIGRAHV